MWGAATAPTGGGGYAMMDEAEDASSAVGGHSAASAFSQQSTPQQQPTFWGGGYNQQQQQQPPQQAFWTPPQPATTPWHIVPPVTQAAAPIVAPWSLFSPPPSPTYAQAQPAQQQQQQTQLCPPSPTRLPPLSSVTPTAAAAAASASAPPSSSDWHSLFQQAVQRTSAAAPLALAPPPVVTSLQHYQQQQQPTPHSPWSVQAMPPSTTTPWSQPQPQPQQQQHQPAYSSSMPHQYLQQQQQQPQLQQPQQQQQPQWPVTAVASSSASLNPFAQPPSSSSSPTFAAPAFQQQPQHHQQQQPQHHQQQQPQHHQQQQPQWSQPMPPTPAYQPQQQPQYQYGAQQQQVQQYQPQQQQQQQFQQYQQPYQQQQQQQRQAMAPTGNALTDSLFQMFGAAHHDIQQADSIRKAYGTKTKNRKKPLANVFIPQFIDAEPTEQTPFPFLLMQGKAFKPHQIYIIQWLWEVCDKAHVGILGALLCADMGLGKTLSGTAYMQLRKVYWPSDRVRWPGFVSCPLALAQPWVDSAREFFGRGFRFLIVHDDWHEHGFSEALRLQDILQFDAIIMTYDSVISAAKKYCAHETSSKTKSFERLTPFETYADAEGMQGLKMMMHVPWSTIICDESQIFASGKTLVKALMALNGGPCICLSGTPIRNTAKDMFYQMRMLGYTGVDQVKHWSLSVYEAHRCMDRVLVMDYPTSGVVLPAMHEHKVLVEFSPEERAEYDAILEGSRKAVDQLEGHMGGMTFASILVLLTRLRQCCDSAYLLTQRGKELQKIPETAPMPTDPPGCNWTETLNGTAGVKSAKMQRICDIFQQVICPSRRKCIIFSNWRSTLLIAKYALDPVLAASGAYCVMVDGKMPNSRFEELLNAFKYDPNCLGLLMTYKYSPAVHLQAIRRCWRIGQTKEVDCWWLYAKDSIEQRIVEICLNKTRISDAFLHGQSEEADLMAQAEGGEEAGEPESEEQAAGKKSSGKLDLNMIKSLLK